MDGSNDTTLAERLRSIGISESYASQIMNGRRKPSLPLALKIHRELGVQLGPIAAASADDIKALERLAANSGHQNQSAA